MQVGQSVKDKCILDGWKVVVVDVRVVAVAVVVVLVLEVLVWLVLVSVEVVTVVVATHAGRHPLLYATTMSLTTLAEYEQYSSLTANAPSAVATMRGFQRDVSEVMLGGDNFPS